ncbi:MAG: HAD-IIB family hydrolase [Deltaproteobacteria bacterium]|nr:HAD-IIB family hydrolase [Deltaproteobacteria bacterium]
MPRPIAEFDAGAARGLVGLFTDLDDTLTEAGRVVPAAFTALDRARSAGLRTVIVTGRPAGWVDHLARMWPVDGVVGENGGLWFWHDGTRLQRRFLQPAPEREANRTRLGALAASIPAEVPGSAVSADQPYRELDLAIDFAEDVPELSEAEVDAIVRCFESAGATCKISSIHVNGWYGAFDKLEGCRRFVREVWGEDLSFERWAFLGDSQNDEPMFRVFPHAIGVANVARFLPRLRWKPAYITTLPGGRGFAEALGRILSLRG